MIICQGLASARLLEEFRLERCVDAGSTRAALSYSKRQAAAERADYSCRSCVTRQHSSGTDHLTTTVIPAQAGTQFDMA